MARLFTIFDARGPEMDQGTMMRYLQEMAWFPTVFLGENIAWKGISDHAADVTFFDGGRSVSARLYFDDEGRLLTFKAERYAEKDGDFAMRMWTTPMTEYCLRGGLNLPVRGQAVWHMPEGDLNKPFYVNVPNKGAVSNMNDDAFLELLCDIDMNGPKPRSVGEMPRGIRGMQEVILDTHELTAEAVIKGDYGLLRRR